MFKKNVEKKMSTLVLYEELCSDLSRKNTYTHVIAVQAHAHANVYVQQ